MPKPKLTRSLECVGRKADPTPNNVQRIWYPLLKNWEVKLPGQFRSENGMKRESMGTTHSLISKEEVEGYPMQELTLTMVVHYQKLLLLN